MRVGVLALQGGFASHVRALSRAGYMPKEVRRAADLEGLDGVVLPGGESTTQHRLLLADAELEAALLTSVYTLPTFATCAGLILASDFGWIDIEVVRNAYGPQVHSGTFTSDEGRAVLLIRAPRIERCGPGVEVLRRLSSSPILVREGNFVGATYHPELIGDEEPYRLAFRRHLRDVAGYSAGDADGPTQERSDGGAGASPGLARASRRLAGH